jgi:hypothetical protein
VDSSEDEGKDDKIKRKEVTYMRVAIVAPLHMHRYYLYTPKVIFSPVHLSLHHHHCHLWHSQQLSNIRLPQILITMQILLL